MHKTRCYECGHAVLEINKNSRCLTCVTRHNDVNKEIAEKCMETLERIKLQTGEMVKSVYDKRLGR